MDKDFLKKLDKKVYIGIAVVVGVLLIAIMAGNPFDSGPSRGDLMGEVIAATQTSGSSSSTSDSGDDNCVWNGIRLHGKVQFVDSFPDIKIKYVSSFGDIDVQFVSSFPDDCGQWQEVSSFPDFTVQVVDSFPDLEVRKVSSFPGMN